MNIFILHKNPKKCAQMHCDKHVIKMILETAQILSTVVQQKFGNPLCFLYKSTHLKHPCVIWAGKNRQNFLWLCRLGEELCKEYEFRYGKTHKSKEIIDCCWACSSLVPNSSFKTPFAQAMPDKYKNKNAVKAYRNYYNGEKLKFCKWTNRAPPKWIRW